MLTPEERATCEIPLLTHMETMYSPGLTNLIHGAFLARRNWLSPTDVRDYLKSIGANFDQYRSNPLASIHSILRRMTPRELETRITNGKRVYKLKTVENFGASMLGDVQGWL